MNVQVFVRCVTEAMNAADADDEEILPTQRDPNVVRSTIPCPAPRAEEEAAAVSEIVA